MWKSLRIAASIGLTAIGICLAVGRPTLATVPGAPECPALQDRQDPDPEGDLDVDRAMAEATQLIAGEKFAEAVELYRRVIKKDANHAEAWHMLGYGLHVSGKLDEAIEAHTRAAAFEESEHATLRATSLYNLGCVHSLKNQPDLAFKFLDRAIDAGFRQLDYFSDDSDLDNIRGDKRFAGLVERVRNRGQRPLRAEDLAGQWTLIASEKAGAKSDTQQPPYVFEATGTEFRLPAPDGGEGFVMSYKIDTDSTPAQVDMEITAGPAVGGKAMGIIELKNGRLSLCYDPSGEKRPEKFATSAEDGFFLFRSERAKSGNPDETPKPMAMGADSLVGSWQVVSGRRAGEDVADDRLQAVITIDAGKITIPAGEESFVMGYSLDTSHTPATIDMEILAGPAPAGSKALGIVIREGDKVRLCYDPTATSRPEKFESSSENGFFLFEMKPDRKK